MTVTSSTINYNLTTSIYGRYISSSVLACKSPSYSLYLNSLDRQSAIVRICKISRVYFTDFNLFSSIIS